MSNGLIITIYLIILFVLAGIVQTYIVNIFFSSATETPNESQNELIAIFHNFKIKKVIDLGSGSGRFMITVYKSGIEHISGYEISPILTFVSRVNVFLNCGFRSKVRFDCYDFLSKDLSKEEGIFINQNQKVLRLFKSKFRNCLNPKAIVFSFNRKIPNTKITKEIKLSDGKVLMIYKGKDI